MKIYRMKRGCYETVLTILLGAACIALGFRSLSAQQPMHHGVDLTVTRPEAVGFSSERIERLHTLMQHSVDQKQIAGAVTILARHGKVIDYRAYGQRDMASGSPMSTDVIFRDFSMTKPVT